MPATAGSGQRPGLVPLVSPIKRSRCATVGGFRPLWCGVSAGRRTGEAAGQWTRVVREVTPVKQVMDSFIGRA